MALPATNGCPAALISFETANGMWALEAEMKTYVKEKGAPTPEVASDWVQRRKEVERAIRPCLREWRHDRPHRDAEGEEWWEDEEDDDGQD